MPAGSGGGSPLLRAEDDPPGAAYFVCHSRFAFGPFDSSDPGRPLSLSHRPLLTWWAVARSDTQGSREVWVRRRWGNGLRRGMNFRLSSRTRGVATIKVTPGRADIRLGGRSLRLCPKGARLEIRDDYTGEHLVKVREAWRDSEREVVVEEFQRTNLAPPYLNPARGQTGESFVIVHTPCLGPYEPLLVGLLTDALCYAV